MRLNRGGRIVFLLKGTIVFSRAYLYFLFFFFILTSGCSHVISDTLRARVDPSLTFREVFQNPNAYKGKIVVWGGEILQTLPQKDRTTLIEVLDWPLGWRGKPKRTVAF
jgi:outer membrane lipoprotein